MITVLPMIEIRRGDHVFHRPSREKWVVMSVDGEHMSWCGWPPGRARISDCLLTYRPTKDENDRFFSKPAPVDNNISEPVTAVR